MCAGVEEEILLIDRVWIVFFSLLKTRDIKLEEWIQQCVCLGCLVEFKAKEHSRTTTLFLVGTE